MDFKDLSIKNSIGCSKVSIKFETENKKIYKKNLHFYISYIENNNRVYLCALDFNAITSFNLDIIKNQKDEEDIILVFQSEIFKRIQELTKEYVCFYKDNFKDTKIMKSFIRKSHFSLWKSYGLIVIKSYFKRLINTTYSPENNNINEYKNYKNTLRVSNGTALLL